jgi:hypothetical protein
VFQLHLKTVTEELVELLKLPKSINDTVKLLYTHLLSKIDIATSDTNSPNDTFLEPLLRKLKPHLIPHFLVPHYIPAIFYYACQLHSLPIFLADIHNNFANGNVNFLNIKVQEKIMEYIYNANDYHASYWFNHSTVPLLDNVMLVHQRLSVFFKECGFSLPQVNPPLIWIRLIREFDLDRKFLF